MGETLSMRISGSGLARNALRQIKDLERIIEAMEGDEDADVKDDIIGLEPYQAEAAIKGFYDTVLALVSGRTTIEVVKDFMFNGVDVQKAELFNELIAFTEPEKETA